MRANVCRGLITLIVSAVAPHAWAQPAPPPPQVDGAGESSDGSDKPWTKGVTPEQREKAQVLLGEGNQLFLESKHREALAKYREALALYDHPAIRFNIARSLINLDRRTEAFDNIQAALRYGKPPLGNLYDEAKNYERLLQSQIAELEIKCTQRGVAVTVDGQVFATCPVTRSMRLDPGKHQVVGRKSDYLTLTQDVNVFPGKKEPFELKLISLADATVTKRRWANWKPWAVVAGGAAVGGIGVLLELQARSTRSQYADILTSLCSDQPCTTDTVSDSTWQSAKLQHAIAVSVITERMVAHSPNGIDVQLAIDIVLQALDGLGHAHANGVVHRDIKGANLLVGRDENRGPAVKLSDFGLAKSYETSGAGGLTNTGDWSGTIPFVSPEQVLDFRNVRPQSDLYSMGATLYHLLTGKFAYNFRPEVAPLVAILEEPIVPVRSHRPLIPAGVAEVIEIAMRKEPAKRFASAHAMRNALLAARH